MVERSIRYTLGGESFTSKKAVGERVAGILHGYALGTPLVPPDLDVVSDLLLWHPAVDDKLSGGCVDIIVDLSAPTAGRVSGS